MSNNPHDEHEHDLDDINVGPALFAWRVLRSETDPLQILKNHVTAAINHSPEARGGIPAVILHRRHGSPGLLAASNQEADMDTLEEFVQHIVDSQRDSDNPIVEVTLAATAYLLITDQADPVTQQDIMELRRQFTTGQLDIRDWAEPHVVITTETVAGKSLVSHAPIMSEGEWRTLGAWLHETAGVDAEVNPVAHITGLKPR